MAVTNGVEARQHPRYTVEIQARILVDGENLNATTRDIGRGGICLIGPRQVPPGHNLQLSLLLLLGASPFSETLDLSARVVWCTAQDDRYQLGAAFTEMTPAKLGQLDMFLRFLEQEILVGNQETPGEEEKFDTGDIDEEP